MLAGLYLASIGPYWNITPDSAGYVQWAKALAAGEVWGQNTPQPPVTSLVFATLLFWFPKGYTALNAVTAIFLLLSLGLAYVLLTQEGGRGRALLAVVLSLASIALYRETTRLLSEPTYMVCSIGALLLLERSSRPSRAGALWRERLGELLAGVLLVICALTRTVGITLALAVLLVEGLATLRRQRRPRVLLVIFALLALLAVAIWEVWAGQHYVANWIRGLLPATDPVTAGPQHPSLSLTRLAVFGELFHNTRTSGTSGLRLLWRIGGPLCFALGVGLTIRRRLSVTAFYVLLYLVVIATHLVIVGDVDPRFLVPVIPFIFCYALDGANAIVTIVQRRAGSFPAWALRALGTLYLIWFAGSGIATAAAGVREAHTSPFGAYLIKRRANYDLERLARVLNRISRPEDRYAAAQQGLVDVLTERTGSQLPPQGTLVPDSFLDWIKAHRIRYVLVDHGTFADTASVRVAIRNAPDVFHLVSALPRASLYEVQPWQP